MSINGQKAGSVEDIIRIYTSVNPLLGEVLQSNADCLLRSCTLETAVNLERCLAQLAVKDPGYYSLIEEEASRIASEIKAGCDDAASYQRFRQESDFADLRRRSEAIINILPPVENGSHNVLSKLMRNLVDFCESPYARLAYLLDEMLATEILHNTRSVSSHYLRKRIVENTKTLGQGVSSLKDKAYFQGIVDAMPTLMGQYGTYCQVALRLFAEYSYYFHGIVEQADPSLGFDGFGKALAETLKKVVESDSRKIISTNGSWRDTATIENLTLHLNSLLESICIFYEDIAAAGNKAAVHDVLSIAALDLPRLYAVAGDYLRFVSLGLNRDEGIEENDMAARLQPVQAALRGSITLASGRRGAAYELRLALQEPTAIWANGVLDCSGFGEFFYSPAGIALFEEACRDRKYSVKQQEQTALQDMAAEVLPSLAGTGRLVVHDLFCGLGKPGIDVYMHARDKLGSDAFLCRYDNSAEMLMRAEMMARAYGIPSTSSNQNLLQGFSPDVKGDSNIYLCAGNTVLDMQRSDREKIWENVKDSMGPNDSLFVCLRFADSPAAVRDEYRVLGKELNNRTLEYALGLDPAEFTYHCELLSEAGFSLPTPERAEPGVSCIVQYFTPNNPISVDIGTTAVHPDYVTTFRLYAIQKEIILDELGQHFRIGNAVANGTYMIVDCRRS